MKRIRIVLPVVLAGAVLLVGGCGDQSPVAPVARQGAPHASRWGPLLGSLANTSLLACSPLPYDSVTETIGPAGGTLAVGADTLVVPPGALAAPTAITGVTPADTVDLVQFQPQGLQFQQPASLTMGYGNCSLLGSLLPKQVAYVNDALQILDLLPSADLLQGSVTAKVFHFSGYAVAW